MAEKGSVTGNVIHYIRKNIADGTWKVGECIPSENQMCKILGVSRISVRSALQKFTALGILKSVHGKGTYLISDDLSLFSSPSEEKPQSTEIVQGIKDILEFRSLVEPNICERVAQTASAELIENLGSLLQTMRDSVGSTKQFVDSDVKFHMEICRACNNPVTIAVMSDIFNKRADYGYMLNMAVGYYGGIYYHTLLLDAFKAHDGKRARTLMMEHLQNGLYDLDSDNPRD